MFNLGPTELILILVVALVIFGPGKLPELGKSMGKAINEFKKSSREIQKEITDSINEPASQTAPAPKAEAVAKTETTNTVEESGEKK